MNNLYLLKNQLIKRRLTKEFDVLQEKQFLTELFFVDDSQNEIIVVCKQDNRSYKFMINTTRYPFVPPTIYYNGYMYGDFLRLNDFQRSMLKRVKGIGCFCCNTFNCSDKWCPALFLINIIDEMKDIQKFKKDVLNIIIAEKIKNKYLLPEIDINSWLI